MRTNPTLAVLFALALPTSALAGGFAISEIGSQASGRGAAAAALYDDPSAVFYNPANIVRLKGLQLSLGVSGLMPQWEYTAPGADASTAVKSNSGIVTPPSFSATYLLGDPGIGDLAVGVGFYAPYGSSFSWPDDWVGRSAIQKIALQVFELTPVLAWRPHKKFALGAGFRYLPANVYLKQAVQFGSTQEGEVELAGSGSGFGGSVGLSFWPIEPLSFAFTWRSAVTVAMTGTSNFFQFSPPFDTEAHDRDVRTKVPLAEVFRVGVAWDVLPQKLNFSTDLEYQLWSTFQALEIRFVQADGTEQVVSSPRHSKDSFVFHVGGEYKITEKIAVRAGYVYDQRTLPEATVNAAPPDSDRHIVSVGASVAFKNFAVHAHFANVFFAQRTSLTSDQPGTWRGGYPGGTTAYIFGLSLTANLDLKPLMGSAPATTTTTTILSAADSSAHPTRANR